MDAVTPRFWEVFFDVHSGLPRQGPGDSGSTKRALALCTGLPEEPRVLDIGCGPGMQTLVLAESTAGMITAVDNHDEFLDQLRDRLEQASLADRVDVKNGDMAKLDFPEESFDLIWCEGAAFVMGIREALVAWRPLLRRDGYLAFSELVWLDENPSGEVAEFFASEYAPMTNIEAVSGVIREAGYEQVGGFTLPDSSWWDHYCTPLEAKLPALKQKYAGDEEAMGVVAMTEKEIDVRRRFAQSYGYQFFVARKRD